MWCPRLLWVGVGGDINKAAKEKHIDRDMLSRKMNLQHRSSSSRASTTGLDAMFDDKQHCIKKCQAAASGERRGHREALAWDVQADNSHQACTVLTRLNIHAEGGGRKAINLSSCLASPCYIVPVTRGATMRFMDRLTCIL